MYDTIDSDPDVESQADDQGNYRPPRWLWIAGAGLAGILVIVYFSWFAADKPAPDNNDLEELLVYRTSISEPVAALRRARLYDFQSEYPSSNRMQAVQAQLAVLDAAEAQSWSELSEVFFDTDKSRADKLAAIQLFEREWGRALIGGRETELTQYKTLLDQSNESEWDWSTKKPRRIASNISGSELAGAPAQGRAQRLMRPAIAPVSIPKNITIQEPRIRRNTKPYYPLKAKRRGYEAEIVLRLNIDDRGRVAMTELVSARADRYRKDFIKASERAALRSRYFPKTINGKPVPASGIVKKYTYRLTD